MKSGEVCMMEGLEGQRSKNVGGGRRDRCGTFAYRTGTERTGSNASRGPGTGIALSSRYKQRGMTLIRAGWMSEQQSQS